MGCICSQPQSTTDSVGGSKSESKHRAQEEGFAQTKSAKFGGVSIRYGYMSQRGFYPDESDKPNQDSYSVTNNVANEESDAMFAVYDGHGKHGDLCAQYARSRLPTLISNYSKKIKKKLSTRSSLNGREKRNLTSDQIINVCTVAHRSCNIDMHQDPHLNDNLSGTTAISCLFQGEENRIIVSNVGDSRAVLGQKVERKSMNGGDGEGKENVPQSYRALPLSSDQTPYRADERQRIRATGARILSLDQIEGLEPVRDDEEQYPANDHFLLGEEIDEGGDPPRVWSSHGDYPGTAFTRSLGDSIAEQLGVFAEPEVLIRELKPEDRIIVLATDGVFEFLTNQSVIDICAKFDDPLEACRAVVAESYELWLQYELRTDDITMICIFVDSIDGSHVNVEETIPHNGERVDGDGPQTTTESKPVRQGMSKNASKALVQMKNRLIDETDELPEDFDINNHYSEKTEDEKSRITKAIESVTMLKNLTPKQKDMVIGLMEPINVKKDDWIIRQGKVGDRFFIVDDGCFEVRKIPQGQEDDTGTGGKVVHTYNGSAEHSRFPTFGEFALINQSPRAASIIAQTDGKLWALHKFSFREIYSEHEKIVTLVEALRKIPELSELEEDMINTFAEGMEEITYNAEDTIVQDGDEGSSFYVIREGKCEVIHREEQPVVFQEAGSHFGEEVICDNTTHYEKTIVAKTPTICWVGKVASIINKDE